MEDITSLKHLKGILLGKYTNDELYMIVKEIYEAYETELLNQSELFFNNILKNFSIKEMDKELF